MTDEKTKIATTLEARAQKIRLLVMDVDGVLSDGRITYTASGEELKSFNVKDGQGIALLHQAGIQTAIITARTSPINTLRCKELGITHVFQGAKKKLETLTALATKHHLALETIAYIGDDLPDFKPMQVVGLAACPNDAVKEIQVISHFVSEQAGGQGAIRSLTDFILTRQGKYPSL